MTLCDDDGRLPNPDKQTPLRSVNEKLDDDGRFTRRNRGMMADNQNNCVVLIESSYFANVYDEKLENVHPYVSYSFTTPSYDEWESDEIKSI